MLRYMYLFSALMPVIAGFCIPAACNGEATASTFYVGACKPGKQADFATIQQAVSTVPSGSTVNVCPGNYPEQVTITVPLTLNGVQSGDNASVVISAPVSGLVTTGTVSVGAVAGQLAVVATGGPVNINGIVVDGSGLSASLLPPNALAANILYLSSSGTVNHAVLKDIPGGNFSSGLLVADPLSISPLVTVEDSFLSLSPATSSYGVSTVDFTVSINVANSVIFSPPGLCASCSTIAINAVGEANTITGNTISLSADSSSSIGIDVYGIQATVKGNAVTNSGVAIFAGVQTLDAEDNTLASNQAGLVLSGEDKVQTLTFQRNTLSSTGSGTGIYMACYFPSVAATISGNTFIGIATALEGAPAGLALPKVPGNYFGVQTIEQVCQ